METGNGGPPKLITLDEFHAAKNRRTITIDQLDARVQTVDHLVKTLAQHVDATQKLVLERTTQALHNVAIITRVLQRHLGVTEEMMTAIHNELLVEDKEFRRALEAGELRKDEATGKYVKIAEAASEPQGADSGHGGEPAVGTGSDVAEPPKV